MLEKIEKIYLCMGSSCNLNCKYCSQHKTSFKLQNNIVSDKLKNYLLDIIKYRDNSKNKIEIVFWGGEPLLYIDTIKYIISLLGDNMYYGMVTNGSLLTEDIVNFINDNNIFITISNDGPNTLLTRGYNVLEDNCILELLKKIKKLTIETVLTTYSYDILENDEYFKRKLGKEIDFTIDTLYCFEDTPKELYTFDKESYKKFDSVCKFLFNKIYYELTVLNKASHYYSIMRPLIISIINKEQDNINPICDINHKRLDIDMDGNILTCHNYNKKIGTVDSLLADIEYNQDKIILEEDNKCKICNFRDYCLHCPHPDYSLIGNVYICNLRKIMINNCLSFISNFNSLYETVDL